MIIFYCLRCGAKKHGTKATYKAYPCDCGGFLIPISRNMVGVAERLHSLGFQVREAQDYASLLLEHDNVRVTLVHVAFRRKYAPEIFQNLPAGWVYQLHPLGDPPFCSVVCCEHNESFSVIPDSKEIKCIITEIDMWVRNELTEENVAVYRLAGLL